MSSKFLLSGKTVFVPLFFLYLISFLQAQDTEALDSKQRLSWIGDEYALHYEVIIEKEEEGEYRRLLQEFTSEFFIEFSLPPGKYRYGVIPYDLLNRPVDKPEWRNFEVLLVFAPELDSPGELQISIEDPDLIEHEIVVVPPPPPSLLAQILETLEYFAGISWTPVYPIRGEMEQLFGQSFYPIGANARLGAISNKGSFLNVGLEIALSWYSLSASSDRHYANMDTFTFDYILLLQKLFLNEKLAFSARIGVGIDFRSGEIIYYEEEPGTIKKQIVHAILGGSLLFITPVGFFVEAGFDYPYLLPIEAQPETLRPWVSIGMRF